MKILIAIFLFVFASLTLAQEQPVYKEGERMTDGLICHQGVLVCIKLYPDRTCDWGCDLDKNRTIRRSLEQRQKDRAIRDQEWQKLKDQGAVPLK